MEVPLSQQSDPRQWREGIRALAEHGGVASGAEWSIAVEGKRQKGGLVLDRRSICLVLVLGRAQAALSDTFEGSV